jgi:hypothetical protein
MIQIKLSPSLFASPDGLFFKQGVPPNRAVLHVGSGRNDLPLGKLATGTAANLSYRGGQNVLLISTGGTQIEDIMLETIINNENYRAAYGVQLIDFVERGLVEVYEDNVLVTATALRTYMAP